jgi:hypothetical protein
MQHRTKYQEGKVSSLFIGLNWSFLIMKRVQRITQLKYNTQLPLLSLAFGN